jgi:histidinol-phosphatase (PHP family)
VYDYHVHSNYSDGRPLGFMLNAAADAGLSGIGFADHCNVYPSDGGERHRKTLGFNLDLTLDRRREAIELLDDEHEIDVFDAVEMDYHPAYHDEIASFLDDAGFDYAIGSVHELDRTNVHVRSHFADKPESERRDLVDRYFEKLEAMIDSELFAIAAHPDLVERNPYLRGFATDDHYERITAAFADSRTVPEINAGRVLDDYGEFHPSPGFLDALVDHGVDVTVGSDSHRPEAIEPRQAAIRSELDERGLDPAWVIEGDDVTPTAD